MGTTEKPPRHETRGSNRSSFTTDIIAQMRKEAFIY